MGAVLLLPVISSCSPDTAHAADRFDASGLRVFEAYRSTGTVTKSVALPQDVSEFVLSMDCIGSDGFVDVAVSGVPNLDGQGGVPCRDTSGPGGLITVSAGNEEAYSMSTVKVTVTAPEGAEWSAAVDIRTPL
jgi:hypothetical protein